MNKLFAVVAFFFNWLFIATNANAYLIDLNHDNNKHRNSNLLISYGGGGGNSPKAKAKKKAKKEKAKLLYTTEPRALVFLNDRSNPKPTKNGESETE